jgi:hypothetical protein
MKKRKSAPATRSAPSILNPICRGVVGYISYWATCSLSEVYSEYHLYAPLAFIANSKKFNVSCEVPVGERIGRGDHKRIDFVLKNGERRIAIELKWATKLNPDLKKDADKLLQYKDKYPDSECFIIVFFRRKNEKEHLAPKSIENSKRGDLVFWNAGKTHYAAQWFKIS